jgi:mannose-6-phosphate isomerase-like protein (cupin superfamily)
VPGYVVQEGDVDARREPGDTAETRVAIDASSGCELLEQRIVRYAPGRSTERTLQAVQEVMYVVSGRGTLYVDGDEHALEPMTGAFVAPGESFAVENPGPDDILVVSVRAPADDAEVDPERRRVTVRWADQPSLPATPNREFRYLVNQDAGCLEVTQFVGIIPPGRAGMHSHTYDEVVYVVEGEGVIHLDGDSTPLRPGTCVHLPPLLEHCLENTGPTPMTVLGVFHPSGDPASRAYEQLTA